MPTLFRPTIQGLGLRLPVLGALAVLVSAGLAVHSAAAQSATGTVTGRVLWGSCLRAIPLPMTPEGREAPLPMPMPMTPEEPGQPQSTIPGAPDVQPAPGRPVPAPITGIPAGAVLVAVQNTAVSARTDEAGRFSLSGVPAGQYLIVAAGPVANAPSATAERPNVFVNGSQTVDIGTLSLGGPSPTGVACRYPMMGGAAESSPGEAPAPTNP